MVKRVLFLAVAAMVLMAVSAFAQTPTTPKSEQITITTYYPSPYGVYKTLRLYPNADLGIVLGDACANLGEMVYQKDDNIVMYCAPATTGTGNKWQHIGSGGFDGHLTTSRLWADVTDGQYTDPNCTPGTEPYDIPTDCVKGGGGTWIFAKEISGAGTPTEPDINGLVGTDNAHADNIIGWLGGYGLGDPQRKAFVMSDTWIGMRYDAATGGAQEPSPSWIHYNLNVAGNNNVQGALNVDGRSDSANGAGGNAGRGVQPSVIWGNLTVHGTLTATTKNFATTHPLDSGKTLYHSSLEGPEIGVYYRGEAKLVKGQATIILPDYFEALTRKENRTVILTCKNGYSPLYYEEINDGKFIVKTTKDGSADQAFSWEVKAIRADLAPLVVEQMNNTTEKLSKK